MFIVEREAEAFENDKISTFRRVNTFETKEDLYKGLLNGSLFASFPFNNFKGTYVQSKKTVSGTEITLSYEDAEETLSMIIHIEENN